MSKNNLVAKAKKFLVNQGEISKWQPLMKAGIICFEQSKYQEAFNYLVASAKKHNLISMHYLLALAAEVKEYELDLINNHTELYELCIKFTEYDVNNSIGRAWLKTSKAYKEKKPLEVGNSVQNQRANELVLKSEEKEKIDEVMNYFMSCSISILEYHQSKSDSPYCKSAASILSKLFSGEVKSDGSKEFELFGIFSGLVYISKSNAIVANNWLTLSADLGCADAMVALNEIVSLTTMSEIHKLGLMLRAAYNDNPYALATVLAKENVDNKPFWLNKALAIDCTKLTVNLFLYFSSALLIHINAENALTIKGNIIKAIDKHLNSETEQNKKNAEKVTKNVNLALLFFLRARIYCKLNNYHSLTNEEFEKVYLACIEANIEKINVIPCLLYIFENGPDSEKNKYGLLLKKVSFESYQEALLKSRLNELIEDLSSEKIDLAEIKFFLIDALKYLDMPIVQEKILSYILRLLTYSEVDLAKIDIPDFDWNKIKKYAFSYDEHMQTLYVSACVIQKIDLNTNVKFLMTFAKTSFYAAKALGEYYRKQKEPQQALKIFEEVIENLDELRFKLYFYLEIGKLYNFFGEKSGVQRKRAIKVLEKLIANGEFKGLFCLAELYLVEGNQVNAIRILRDYLKEKPEDVEAQELLCEALYFNYQASAAFELAFNILAENANSLIAMQIIGFILVTNYADFKHRLPKGYEEFTGHEFVGRAAEEISISQYVFAILLYINSKSTYENRGYKDYLTLAITNKKKPLDLAQQCLAILEYCDEQEISLDKEITDKLLKFEYDGIWDSIHKSLHEQQQTIKKQSQNAMCKNETEVSPSFAIHSLPKCLIKYNSLVIKTEKEFTKLVARMATLYGGSIMPGKGSGSRVTVGGNRFTFHKTHPKNKKALDAKGATPGSAQAQQSFIADLEEGIGKMPSNNNAMK